MSGFNADDRYDGPDDRGGDDPRAVIDRARSRVRVPAVLLIVTGALGLLMALFNLVNVGNLGPQLDEQLAAQNEKVENNPNLNADQKKEQKEMFGKVFDTIKSVALPFYLVNVLVAGVVLFGGVKMLGLSGRGLAITGSVLAMIPCVNSVCCLLGLPAGIWAIVAMANPTVRAGFAARAGRASAPPDAY
jgi:hypothetical protein